MSEITIIPITAEPEETIEVALCGILANACTIPVEGALTPATEGTVKRLSSDTFISVMVDLASQDLDQLSPAMFITLTANVAVHYALADDADGSSYRDECRRCRAALVALTGDGCAALTTASVAVDGFVINSTTTSFEAGDNPVNTKTYTATVHCRVLQTTADTTNNEPTEEEV